MADAVEFSDQTGTSLEPLATVIARPDLLRGVKQLECFPVVTTKGLFLQLPRKGSQQQVAPQRLWWLTAKFCSPGGL
jgi:hypothetical protein